MLMVKKGEEYFLVKKDNKEEIISVREVSILKVTKKNITIKGSLIKLNSDGIYNDGDFEFSLQEKTEELYSIKEKLDIKNKYIEAKERVYNLKPVPKTRIFKIGEEVNLGKVIDIYDNNKFYLIEKFGDKNVYPWINVYKNNEGNFEFAQRNTDRISFHHQHLFSLIHKHYNWNINYSPFYQRDYVWSLEDKVELIKSIFNNIDIGKFAFIENDLEDKYDYEILDGKQRLNALIEFYEDGFMYEGKYFSELSNMDKNHFLGHNVSVGEAKSYSNEKKLRYFYNLNSKGRAMDKEHLRKIEEMIKEEQMKK